MDYQDKDVDTSLTMNARTNNIERMNKLHQDSEYEEIVRTGNALSKRLKRDAMSPKERAEVNAKRRQSMSTEKKEEGRS